MSDTQPFALLVLAVAGAGLLAVLFNRVSERIQVPTPALFLVGAAVAAAVLPGLSGPRTRTVERLVTIALLAILYDGGLHMGWSRFRRSLSTIATVGVLGTFLTVAGTAVLARAALGVSWYVALLVGTAIAPTDPAVVFSVLGQREIKGRSGTILEGESGANDPVGIALMASLLAAGGLSSGAFPQVSGEFLLQMVVGLAVGVAGGRLMLLLSRRLPLPNEGLYPLRSVASVLVLFALATLAHGSGFLAVFAAGITLGDERAPYKREIEGFHSALASIAEIIAFVALGLTVDLGELSRFDVWGPGLLLGAGVAFVVRPLLVGPLLLQAGLRRGERTFVLFAGLKGAVPILLGSFLLEAHVPDAPRLYAVIVVVVVFSVVVQGSLVPTAARLLRVPMRAVLPEPFSLGIRLRDEPEGMHRLVVAAGSPADGSTLDDLESLPPDAWVSLVIRDLRLVTVTGRTQLRAGDEVLVLADAELRPRLAATFEQRTP